MKTHTLKINDRFYKSKVCGVKSFELRKDDRGFKVGDYVHYVDEDGDEIAFDTKNLFEIVFILKDYPGLEQDYVIYEERRIYGK